MEGDSDIVDVVSRPSPAIRRKGGRVGDFASRPARFVLHYAAPHRSYVWLGQQPSASSS